MLSQDRPPSAGFRSNVCRTRAETGAASHLIPSPASDVSQRPGGWRAEGANAEVANAAVRAVGVHRS